MAPDLKAVLRSKAHRSRGILDNPVGHYVRAEPYTGPANSPLAHDTRPERGASRGTSFACRARVPGGPLGRCARFRAFHGPRTSAERPRHGEDGPGWAAGPRRRTGARGSARRTSVTTPRCAMASNAAALRASRSAPASAAWPGMPCGRMAGCEAPGLHGTGAVCAPEAGRPVSVRVPTAADHDRRQSCPTAMANPPRSPKPHRDRATACLVVIPPRPCARLRHRRRRTAPRPRVDGCASEDRSDRSRR